MKQLVAMLALLGWAEVGLAQVQTQGWILADTTWSGPIEVVGDVMVTNNATLTVAAGSSVTFMSNSLSIYIPQVDANARILFLGEATNRIQVKSVPGLVTNGTVGRYGTSYAKEIRAEYVDFSALGYSGTVYAIYHAPRETGDVYAIRHCTFSNCFEVSGWVYGTGAVFSILNNDFRDSRAGNALNIQGTISGSPENRMVAGNTADAGFSFGASALIQTNVLVGTNASIAVLSAAARTQVAGNYVVLQKAGSAVSMAASNTIVRDNYLSSQRDCLGVSALLDCQVVGNVMQAAAGATRHVNGVASYSIFASNILFGVQPATEAIYISAVRTNVTIRNNVIAGRSITAINVAFGANDLSDLRVRNNIFYHCAAASRPVINYATGLTNIISEADYNCFYSTNALNITNYGSRVTVAGKSMRVSAGFGLHDLEDSGAINQQVDPLLAGPITGITVATSADLLARTHTIDDVLAEARSAFALTATSPCVDAGDPADGAGTEIGLAYVSAVDPNDTDADDLVDSWEMDNFGSLTNEASGDVDGDGLLNVEEFIAQTQPTNAQSRFIVTALTNGPSRYVAVPSVTGRVYRLWSTPTLVPTQSWSEVAGPVAGTGGTISLTDGVTTNWAVYRLTVEMAAP